VRVVLTVHYGGQVSLMLLLAVAGFDGLASFMAAQHRSSTLLCRGLEPLFPPVLGYNLG
jgi:hypothetical protein